MRFAEIFGNFQMILMLTVLYWTIVLLIAIPFKLLADPLSLRKNRGPSWTDRPPESDVMGSMRRQG
jgi:hypothetical protein